MENEMLSLYDYLGKAAGMELGSAVCKSAVKSKEKIEERVKQKFNLNEN